MERTASGYTVRDLAALPMRRAAEKVYQVAGERLILTRRNNLAKFCLRNYVYRMESGQNRISTNSDNLENCKAIIRSPVIY